MSIDPPCYALLESMLEIETICGNHPVVFSRCLI